MIYWPVRGWSERQRYESGSSKGKKCKEVKKKKKKKVCVCVCESDEVMRKVKVRTMQPRVDTVLAKAFSLDDE